MGINLQIQTFKEKMIQDINDAKLPPGIISAVLGEITGQVQKENLSAIAAEKNALEEGDRKDGKEIRKAELAEQPVNSDTGKCN